MDLSDDSLATALQLPNVVAAEEWAREHGLAHDKHPDHLERLRRVAAAKHANPKIVNPDLPQDVAQKYWKVLYEFAPVLAHSLADIT